MDNGFLQNVRSVELGRIGRGGMNNGYARRINIILGLDNGLTGGLFSAILYTTVGEPLG